MADRVSTQLLQQRGARRLTKDVNGALLNTFQARTGTESALNAANTALLGDHLVSAQLPMEKYFVIKSFFLGTGMSDQTAVTMAVVLLDAAKILRVSAMSLLDEIARNDDTLASFQMIVAINIVSPSDAQHTQLNTKDNANAFGNRNILP